MSILTVKAVNHAYKLVKKNGEWQWASQEQEAEVLSVHFQKNTMRVRGVKWNDEKQKDTPYTWDCSATPFFNKYNVKEN